MADRFESPVGYASGGMVGYYSALPVLVSLFYEWKEK
jgi:hypothetical protein